MLKTYLKENVICIEGTVSLPGVNMTVFSFLVDGMLIDTGAQSLEKDFMSFYQNQSFDLVTLTHSHEDHSGLGKWIKENRNVPIYVHSKGVNVCKESCSYPKYRQMTWGIREPFQALPLEETVHSRHQKWEVIYTPGHADDHVVFYNSETGQLFSGDLFIAPKTKVIMSSESIPILMESIQNILGYDFASMYCCHAGYLPNGKDLLRQKLDYLESLSCEVKEFYQKGWSVNEIDQKLFPKKYPIADFSDGEWDSRHIITSILST